MMRANRRIFFIFLFCGMRFFYLYAYADNILELESPHLKLKVFERTGSFCLYYLSPNGKNNYVPLYSDMAYAHTNKFSVSLDGVIYRLERRLGKPINIEKVNDSIKITFKVGEKLHIEQSLSFIPDEYGNTQGPLLRIETTIENTQSHEASVALRAIFDTSLGEHRKTAPLATDLRENIIAETSFNPKIDRDSVIISSNQEVACMFFFKHGVDVPEQVYIANWERLSPRKWLPTVVEGRNFNSKYLHDDSACLFIWPTKKLVATEVMKITSTIGYHDFIRSSKGYSIQSDILDDEIEKIEASEMTDEQKKNYDYIQELLNRIHAVEENPDDIPDSEIEDLTDQADDAIKDIEEHK